MWTAQALTAAGLPCAHEAACSSWTDEYGDDGLWRTASGGESSWQAAPFAREMQEAGVKVVHLVRHPAEVASSLIANRFLLPREDGLLPWHRFVAEHIGDRIWRLHPHDRALQFWTDWNKQIEQPDLRWLVPVDRFDVDDLGRMLGQVVNLHRINAVPKTVNHRREVERFNETHFTRVIWDDAMDLWRSYF